MDTAGLWASPVASLFAVDSWRATRQPNDGWHAARRSPGHSKADLPTALGLRLDNAAAHSVHSPDDKLKGRHGKAGLEWRPAEDRWLDKGHDLCREESGGGESLAIGYSVGAVNATRGDAEQRHVLG